MIPPEQPLYSWWSYRARDWSAADKGRRLDHVWVTGGLAERVRGARSTAMCAAGKSLDHAPVTWISIDRTGRPCHMGAIERDTCDMI